MRRFPAKELAEVAGEQQTTAKILRGNKTLEGDVHEQGRPPPQRVGYGAGYPHAMSVRLIRTGMSNTVGMRNGARQQMVSVAV